MPTICSVGVYQKCKDLIFQVYIVCKKVYYIRLYIGNKCHKRHDNEMYV